MPHLAYSDNHGVVSSLRSHFQVHTFTPLPLRKVLTLEGWEQFNRRGSYGFEVTAIDGKASGGGNVDKVCIRVWNAATGVVVYDNQMNAAPNPAPTTAIVGSIKIKGVRGKGDTDDDN